MSPATLNGHQPAIYVNRVGIDRMPGITGRFELDTLCSGINIIHGPNASGKTRTAHAIQGLIWPSDAPERAELFGDLTLANDAWYVEVAHRNPIHQRSGSDVAPPVLDGIPASQKDRYLLTLHQLLQAEDPAFARIIHRESAGGYDLNEARKALGADRSSAPKPHPGKARSQHRDAVERVYELRTEDDDLQRHERSIAALEKELDEAVAAASRKRLLEAAIEHAKARELLEGATTVRDQFEDPIGVMTGDEFEQVERLNKKLAELADAQRQAERDIYDATRVCEETGFKDGWPSKEATTALNERLKLLGDRNHDLRRIQEDLATQCGLEVRARERIESGLTDSQLAALDSGGVRKLAALANDYERLASVCNAQAELYAWVGKVQRPTDLDRYRTGIELLYNRLRLSGAQAAQDSRTIAAWALLGAAIVIMIEAALLAIVGPRWFGVFALFATPLVFIAIRSLRRSDDVLAGEHERRYQELGLELPSSWSPRDIAPVLSQLRTRLAEGEVDLEKSTRWDALSTRVSDSAEQVRKVAEQRARLEAEFGVVPNEDPHSLRLIVDALDKWRQASDEVTRREARESSVMREIDSLLAAVNTSFATFEAGPAKDEVEARSIMDELSTRIELARNANATMVQQRNQIDRHILPAQREVKDELNRIYARLGISESDISSLRDWCRRVPECNEAQTQLEQRHAYVNMTRQRLGDEPELAALPRSEVETQLAHTESEANRQQDIQRQITEIRTRIDQAKRTTALEEAVAAEAVALEKLHESRADDCDEVAMWHLSGFVQRRTRDANRPSVFRAAQDLFANFTRGAFELELSDGSDASFRAIETSTGRGLGLNQLSSGTRVQLLMAVRLAFIEVMEQGPQLPLILDETLGNADDVRATAIIDTVIEISRRGRQVIYFTARLEEVAEWQKRAAELEGVVPHAVIDLATARNVAALDRESPIFWSGEIFERVHVPDELDYRSAREFFEVARVDPWLTPMDAVDLWYVIPDVCKLSRLRELGIRTWGQFKAMRLRRLARVFDDFAMLNERAESRAMVIEAALRAWRTGRPRPIDRQVIQASDAVSEVFFDQVMALAENYGWDGGELVAALDRGEVSGFRTKQREELEEFLRTHGHITDDAPLADSAVRASARVATIAPDGNQMLPPEEVDELLQSLGTVASV